MNQNNNHLALTALNIYHLHFGKENHEKRREEIFEKKRRITRDSLLKEFFITKTTNREQMAMETILFFQSWKGSENDKISEKMRWLQRIADRMMEEGGLGAPMNVSVRKVYRLFNPFHDSYTDFEKRIGKEKERTDSYLDRNRTFVLKNRFLKKYGRSLSVNYHRLSHMNALLDF